MGDFKKLDVWHESNAYAHDITTVTNRFAPRHRWLADQMTRAANSIPALIAEGSGLGTDRAFANRVSDAIGETSEVESHVQRAFDERLISEAEYEALTNGAISIRRKLIGLRRTLRGQPRPTNPNRNRPRKPRPKPNPKPKPKA